VDIWNSGYAEPKDKAGATAWKYGNNNWAAATRVTLQHGTLGTTTLQEMEAGGGLEATDGPFLYFLLGWHWPGSDSLLADVFP
jgi:hypothetical protein